MATKIIATKIIEYPNEKILNIGQLTAELEQDGVQYKILQWAENYTPPEGEKVYTNWKFEVDQQDVGKFKSAINSHKPKEIPTLKLWFQLDDPDIQEKIREIVANG